MKTNIEVARSLAWQGFKVFPIQEGAKAPPLVKDFPAVATTDMAKVIRWWERWPRANVGIHCEDLLVIDVDVNKGGVESLLRLELGEHGGLPATMEVETPSGGRHIYFTCKDGAVSNGVDVLGPGIDIRTTRGYVLGPGSCINGKVYHRADTSFWSPGPAPEWLVEKCRKNRTEAITEPPPDGVNAIFACQRAAEWLAQAPVATEGDGGDHHTFAIACKVRDFGVPEDEALEVLVDWNSRCEPPWDLDELQRKIHNAYRYAQNTPGAASVEAMFDIVRPEQATLIVEEDPDLYTPDDVTLESVLKADYLVKGWLDRGSQGLLFGQWGSGKTFIALHIAAHLAAGQVWFGNKVRQGGVLYLGYEGAISMRKRLYALRHEFPDYVLSNFMIRPMRWPLVKKGSTVKTRGMAYVERALTAFEARTGAYPSLVIIDPLRNALGGSDSDPDLTAPFLEYLQKITKVTGCSTLTIHHPGHGDSERGRGDSGIEAAMDTVIRVDGERGRIETKKQRDDPKAALFYALKTVTLGEDSDGDPRTTCVAVQIHENPLDPNLTDQQHATMVKLKEIIGGEEGLVTKTQFRRATERMTGPVRADILETLVKKQFLVPEGKGWRLGEGSREMFGIEEGV